MQYMHCVAVCMICLNFINYHGNAHI